MNNLFVYSFKTYLLIACYVQSTILNTKNTAKNKDRKSYLIDHMNQWQETDNRQNNNMVCYKM